MHSGFFYFFSFSFLSLSYFLLFFLLAPLPYPFHWFQASTVQRSNLPPFPFFSLFLLPSTCFEFQTSHPLILPSFLFHRIYPLLVCSSWKFEIGGFDVKHGLIDLD
ncbi:unnamed protein product [Cuscuta epithymum]|uniref:Uncharacterized protein n=1 Tax=Cuscuta epithymum TaxID=186058 RepID=A0AAV0EZU9_9ASTE|nr:unnamed protein product [Cuscuta epithymum]